MISSSEKQSDKEVETSFVHFMQVYTLYVCHKGTAEAKYHYLAPPPPGTPPDCPRAQAFASFFSFKCTTVLWWGKENVILTKEPFGQSLSEITTFSWNVDQSKLDSQIDP